MLKQQMKTLSRKRFLTNDHGGGGFADAGFQCLNLLKFTFIPVQDQLTLLDFKAISALHRDSERINRSKRSVEQAVC